MGASEKLEQAKKKKRGGGGGGGAEGEPVLAERDVALKETYSTCRELKFVSVKYVILASIRFAL